VSRLRAILLLRGALVVFLLAVGVVLVAGGDAAFGAIVIGAAIVNVVLIVVIARKARGAP
jgi:hypothetical protein